MGIFLYLVSIFNFTRKVIGNLYSIGEMYHLIVGDKVCLFPGGFRRIFSLFCWFTHVEKGNLFLFFAFSFTSFSSLEVSTLCTSTADSLPFNAISPEPDAEEIKQYAVFSKYNFNSKKFKYYIQMSLEKKKKVPL